MLESLTIKNYALFVDVEIRFSSGLNIITGETGAGKSIIIGALSAILGERVDTTSLRDGAKKAVIEGRFRIGENTMLRKLLEEEGLEVGDDLVILRKEIIDTGRSRAFVNDTPVHLSVLQGVGDLLVDLHGQHDHQSLLKSKSHLEFLDIFGGLEQEVMEVHDAYHSLRKLQGSLSGLIDKKQTVAEKNEIYAFQVKEIERISPSEEEEAKLLQEEKIVKNSERLFQLSDESCKILYDSRHSVYDQLFRVQTVLAELAQFDPEFDNYRQDCESSLVFAEEFAKFLQKYRSKLHFDPQRIEEIHDRLAQYSGLKKKYNLTIPEIIRHKDKLKSEITKMENIDDEIRRLRENVREEKAHFSERCINLSQNRARVAEKLEKAVPEILSELGIPDSRFKVDLEYQTDPTGMVSHGAENYRADGTGIDIANFLISMNKGEDVKPLTKVASGGEISRIMLALKSIIARKGQIPVLIFDEIDAGVSGRIAQAVGKKLKSLAQTHQLICITHLPQIASMGNQHYIVEKTEMENRTATEIRQLNENDRIVAVAKLLAGENISETHLNSARELLRDALMN